MLINLLGLARGVVCAYNDRPWARSRLWLALFLACYGAAPLLTWDGPYCFCWARHDAHHRRPLDAEHAPDPAAVLLNSPPVFAYNLIAGSYTGAAIEVAPSAPSRWPCGALISAARPPALPLRPDHSAIRIL